MREQHSSGGNWTEEKLNCLKKYLSAYTKIFAENRRAQYFRTIYVDAFAGTGYRSTSRTDSKDNIMLPELAKSDAQSFLKGSASIALENEPPFSRYLFIERDPKKSDELQKLKNQFPNLANRIEIVTEDANKYLRQWCDKTNWKRFRAVVFLDPYGMEVEWSLIKAIAHTEAIDLWFWLLFPLGVAVNRLLMRNEPPPLEWEQALTRILGTQEWKEAFYPSHKIQTLFGEGEIQRRDANFDSIGQFFVKRLKAVFHSVAENPLPLRNSRNTPIYLLCFAAGNPRGASTAIRIAQDILGR
jgi:three-Cys-motif partner protein